MLDNSEEPVRILEIIGPAGAGKSTLAHLLSQKNQIKLIHTAPYYRRVKDFPFFAINTLETLPTIIQLYFGSHCQRLKPWEVAWMVTLHGWHHILRHETARNLTLVLDEGPIYHMAYLQIYGSGVINSSPAEAWWNKIYKQWSKTLTLLVLLDASDTTLIKRIRMRETVHGVKTKGDDYAFEFLSNLRKKYDYLIARLLSEETQLKVLRFDTQKIPLDQICTDIVAVL
jgi:deoxyadenosine/deoxycytidine kinase